MPRPRRYQPIPDNVCEDRALDMQPESSQVLYFRLLAKCDDAGRYHASPRVLLGHLFPHAEHVSVKDIQERLLRLVESGILCVYVDEAGDDCLQITDYLPSAKSVKPKFDAPDDSVVAEARTRKRGFDAGQTGLFGANGSVKGKRYVYPTETDTETITVTKTETDTETGRGSVSLAARAVESLPGSESGSDAAQSSFGDGSDSESGQFRMAAAAWQACQGHLRAGRDAEAITDFAHACVLVLKPEDASEADYKDVRALGRHLCRGDGARALRERMFRAFNDAKATVEQGGMYGAWRNRMASEFGNWSRGKRREGATA